VTSSNATATVGLPGTTVGGTSLDGFVTAGHLVNGQGAQVSVVDYHGALIGSGTVNDWSDPITQGVAGGYDYAVVLLDKPQVIHPLGHFGPMGAPVPAGPILPYNVQYVGRHANTWSMVNGALAKLGNPTRQWLNCWSAGPCSQLWLGDSGTVVRGFGAGSHQGKIFGHFVGGSFWRAGSFIHQYIQDLEQTNQAGLAQAITF
jgi:hypothetical protein